jgi:hypothetical protein
MGLGDHVLVDRPRGDRLGLHHSAGRASEAAMKAKTLLLVPAPRKFLVPNLRHARNAKAWALGDQKRNGFHVRRVVWGLVMARAERRPTEEIRRAVILVGEKRRR